MPASVTSAVSMVSSSPSGSTYRTPETFSTSTHPSGDYLHLHTVIIVVVIFGMVCFLLLVAFFYAFCFHCTLQASPKVGRNSAGCNMEREDATFRRSSSCTSVGNTV